MPNASGMGEVMVGPPAGCSGGNDRGIGGGDGRDLHLCGQPARPCQPAPTGFRLDRLAARRSSNPAAANARAEAAGSRRLGAGARLAEGRALAPGDRRRRHPDPARDRRRACTFRARRQRGADGRRRRHRGRRCAHPGRIDPRWRGRDPCRSALPARLARAPRLLRAMRDGERDRRGRMGPALPELPGASLSAGRPGGDHARG